MRRDLPSSRHRITPRQSLSSWRLLFSVAAVAALSGCGQGSGTRGAGAGDLGLGASDPGGFPMGGGGGAGGGTSEGGTGDCSSMLAPSICADCLETACCGAVADCLADSSCATCLFNADADPTVCGPNKAYIAVSSCKSGSCAQACKHISSCDPPSSAPSQGKGCFPANAPCNPVSNAGCGAGQVCRYKGGGVFGCETDPGNFPVCTECDNEWQCAIGTSCICEPPFCECTRLCCEDVDCGTGYCEKGIIPNLDLGVCSTSPLSPGP